MSLDEFVRQAEMFHSDDFEEFWKGFSHMKPIGISFVDLEKLFIKARSKVNGMKGNISIQTGTTWKPKYQIGTILVNTYNREEREVFEVDTTNASYVLSNASHGYISLPEYVIDRDWSVKPNPYQFQLGDIVADKSGKEFAIHNSSCVQHGQNGKPEIEYTLRSPTPQGGFYHQIVSEEVLIRDYTLVNPYSSGPSPWVHGTGVVKNGKTVILPAITHHAAKIEFYRNGVKLGTIENGINNPPDGFLGCDHVFVDYQGLIESFRYCKKCDQRENR